MGLSPALLVSRVWQVERNLGVLSQRTKRPTSAVAAAGFNVLEAYNSLFVSFARALLVARAHRGLHWLPEWTRRGFAIVSRTVDQSVVMEQILYIAAA